jgi:hypothetical protein
MYELKRRLQTAADAGALAGAHEIHRSNREGIKSAALYDAKQNGFEADAETDSVVTVNNPPTEGRYAGNPGYVEVITEERAPLFFGVRGRRLPRACALGSRRASRRPLPLRSGRQR